MNVVVEAELDKRLEELRLNNPETERKVKIALRQFLTQTDTTITLNVNPYNANMIREWLMKHYPEISVTTVNKRQNGTEDIVLRKGQKMPMFIDQSILSIDQLVNSLNSNGVVKNSVKDNLYRLVKGNTYSVTLNLNSDNANKVKQWAEEYGYEVSLRTAQNGLVDITIRRHKKVSSLDRPQSNQNLNTGLPKHLDHNFYRGIKHVYEALKGTSFFDYYSTLSDEKKELFLSFMWGVYMRSVNETQKSNPELFGQIGSVRTLFSKLNKHNIISEFEARLERAERQTKMAIEILEQKFSKENKSLKNFLGSNYKEFEKALKYIFMEWKFDDNTINSILNSISYQTIDKLYKALIDFRAKNHRHSPGKDVSNQDLAEISLSTILFSKMFGVDSELILAIIGQESNFRKQAWNDGNIGMTQQSGQGWNMYVFGSRYPGMLENYMKARFKRAGWQGNPDYQSPLVNRTLLANQNITMQIYTGVITLVGKAIEKYGTNTDLSNLDNRKDVVYQIARGYNGSKLANSYASAVVSSPLWNLDL